MILTALHFQRNNGCIEVSLTWILDAVRGGKPSCVRIVTCVKKWVLYRQILNAFKWTLHQNSSGRFPGFRALRVVLRSSDRSFFIVRVREVQNVLYRKARLCVGQRHSLREMSQETCFTSLEIRCFNKQRERDAHSRYFRIGSVSRKHWATTSKANHEARAITIAWQSNGSEGFSSVSPGRMPKWLECYVWFMDIVLLPGC